MLLSLVVSYSFLLPLVSAHYFFPHLIANGNFTSYYEYVRDNSQNYMPMKAGYDSDDFRCRTDSQLHAADTGVYKVKAGDEIGLGTAFDAKIGHPGPLQVYMSKAPGDVREYDGSGDWFKVYELGPKAFSSDGIQWGATDVGNFTFTLPEETPAGQYLVRIEHIGLHGAGEFGGAEFFYNCAQIEVESDSTATPGPLVKIPGLYTGYEPGILFYMYRPWIVNYTMPGPAVWPNPQGSNITASGVSIAPTETQWSLPAVTPGVAQQDGTSSTPTPTASISTDASFSQAVAPATDMRTQSPEPTSKIETSTSTSSSSRRNCPRRTKTVTVTQL